MKIITMVSLEMKIQRDGVVGQATNNGVEAANNSERETKKVSKNLLGFLISLHRQRKAKRRTLAFFTLEVYYTTMSPDDLAGNV